MFRRLVLALAVVVGTSLAGTGYAQMGGGGGGGPGGGGGGFGNMDPALMQQMQDMGQQIMTNMQNAGVDPQQFFQDQMQNGNFDPQAMQQALVDKGYMTADQAAQMNNIMNQMQQNFQQQTGQDMATIRANNALNNIRRQLNVTDDGEWNVLLPKIQRVLSALADFKQQPSPLTSPARGAGGLGGAAGGGAAAGAGGAATSAAERPIDKAWRELQEIVKDAQADDGRIAAKLAAWRQLHGAAKNDLVAAQTDLVGILTLRQETILMVLGVL